jgi:hypothetical protein
MSGAQAQASRSDASRARLVAEKLRAQWRIVERVTVVPAADGVGYRATIHLNQTIVRGAIEQQGAGASPEALETAAERRARAIAECVERCNADLPAHEALRDYEVLA